MLIMKRFMNKQKCKIEKDTVLLQEKGEHPECFQKKWYPPVCEIRDLTKRLCQKCKSQSNKASAKLSVKQKNLKMRRLIRDNALLKTTQSEQAEEIIRLKELDESQALLLILMQNIMIM